MTRRACGFGWTRPWSNSGWFQPIDGLQDQEPDGAKISLWYSFSSLTPLSWKTDLRIPTKPSTSSNLKPSRHSDFKPSMVPR